MHFGWTFSGTDDSTLQCGRCSAWVPRPPVPRGLVYSEPPERVTLTHQLWYAYDADGNGVRVHERKRLVVLEVGIMAASLAAGRPQSGETSSSMLGRNTF